MASNTFGMYEAVLPALPLPLPTTGSILIVTGNPSSLGITANAGSFAYYPAGQTLYYTADGSTWSVALSGAGGGISPQSGHGSPAGVVTPNAVGVLYIDLNTNNIWVANGMLSSNWVETVGS